MGELQHVPGFIVSIVIMFMSVISLCEGASGSNCFCLSKTLSSLRNIVHMEPVILDGKNVYLLAGQYGVIHIYDPKKSGNHLMPYLDLSDQLVVEEKQWEERGLLSIAAHPKFEHNSKLFLYSTRKFNKKDYIVISEITGTDVSSERTLLWVEQPGDKRNGGQVIFGGDDYLYIFIGDGGPPDDQRNDAQNVSSLLGKILRIDVDLTTIVDNKMQYYIVPNDNPRRAGWRDEIYAVGIRNTWRCDKDAGDINGNGKGRLFCGELGSRNADEINQIEKGGNYGWNYKEGVYCFNETICSGMENETLPIQVFNRSSSAIRAVVGGPVYRGKAFPGLYGHLLYGDFVTGSVFSLQEPSGSSKGPWVSNNFTTCDSSLCDCNLRDTPGTHLLSFGESHEGEVFLLMTSDLSPATTKCALFQLSPPRSSPVTCGATLSIAFPLLLIICLLFVVYL